MRNVYRTGRLFVVIGLMAVLGACATPARMSAMIPDRVAETTIAETSPLFSAVSLANVSGG
ncbi:MAG: hypothetical protein OXR84_10520 [Magnetovibrio sp.]|nr:hypothetical protein [Magnetovibrio sp.]